MANDPVLSFTATVKDANATVMDPGYTQDFYFGSYAYVDKSLEVPHPSYGKPNFAKCHITVTLPDGITYNQNDLNGWKIKDGNPNVLENDFTWLGYELTPPNGVKTISYQGMLHLYAKGAKLNKRLPIHVDFEVYTKDKTIQLPSRSIDVQVTPVLHEDGGNCEIGTDGNEWNIHNYLDDEIFKKWSANGFVYYALGNNLYYLDDDFTEVGRYYTNYVLNYNNGPIDEKTLSNHVGYLHSTTNELTDGEYFKKFYVAGYFPTKVNSGYTFDVEAYKKILDDKFNATPNHVYGIDGDTKVVLAKNVKIGEFITLDTTQKFQKITFEFDDPLLVDRGRFIYLTSVGLKDSEYEGYKKQEGNRTYSKRYENHITAQISLGSKTKPSLYHDIHNSYMTYVHPFGPSIGLSSSDPISVIFQGDGAEFDLRLSPYTYQDKDAISWGPMKDVENLTTYTVLPLGIRFDKEKFDNTRHTYVDGTAEVIENFKNTGKTVVKIKYKDFPVEKRSFEVKLPLIAQSYTNKEVILDTYMTYDQNNLIHPISDDQTYVDHLDLDDDYDQKEQFIKASTIVDVTLPLEIHIINQVSDDEVNKDLEDYEIANVDEDSIYHFNIRVENSSKSAYSKLTILDILPHKNDHTIAPNEKGVYEKRGSTMTTPLAQSLESYNDKEVLDMFDIYYEVNETIRTSLNKGEIITPEQHMEMETNWLIKDQVKDFELVTGIKLELKQGMKLASGRSINIKVPVLMPTGVTDDQVAKNSSAFKVGTKFIEGNVAVAKPIHYEITGIVFDDLHSNGIYEIGIDKTIKNEIVTVEPAHQDVSSKTQAVQSLKEPTLPVVDQASTTIQSDANTTNQKALTAVTDENGRYSIIVKHRDHYQLTIQAPGGRTFSTIVKENKEAIHGASNTKDGKSGVFELDPQDKKSIQNAAFVPEYKIVVQKVFDKDVDETTPDVDIILTKTKDQSQPTSETITLTKENNYRYECVKGEYTYQVKEKDENEQKVKLGNKNYQVSYQTHEDHDNYVITYLITNTYIKPSDPYIPSIPYIPFDPSNPITPSTPNSASSS